MRTLRDFMTPALWAICSTASGGRSRRSSRARARSGVRAGSEARARSSVADTNDEPEAAGLISGWDCSGFIGPNSDSTAEQGQQQSQKQNQQQGQKQANEWPPHTIRIKNKINSKVKGDGQECPSYTLRARRRAPSTGSTISGCTCTPGSSQRT